MRPDQIEGWVLSVIDRVTRAQVVEDARVEMKAEWPSPERAARRVAGHANASGGTDILWIVGLDESRGVVPYPSVDLAQWGDQFRAVFDGLALSFTDVTIPSGLLTVQALLFDTSRRPFVVKNPVSGRPGGGPVTLEVPWRDGTQVRSARREDLIRILVPAARLPTIEVLRASASVSAEHPPSLASGRRHHGQSEQHLVWSASLVLYVTPRGDDRIVFPVHRARMELQISGTPEILTVSELSLHPQTRHTGNRFKVDSHTVTATNRATY